MTLSPAPPSAPPSTAAEQRAPARVLLRTLSHPVTAGLVGAAVLGGLLIMTTGQNPFAAYGALVDGAFNPDTFPSTVNRTLPVAGMAIAAAISFRAGFFNLGLEGQIVLGGLAAAVTGVHLPLPGFLLPVAVLVAGTLAGGLYALLAGWLRVWCDMPLVITTLLLNFPAVYLASYLVSGPIRDADSGLAQSGPVASGAHLPLLPGGSVQFGVLAIAAVAVSLHIVYRRTSFGYEMTMAGQNLRFVEYGGTPVRGLMYRVVFLSGGCAGLVGAFLVVESRRFIDGSLTAPSYAWTGLLAALLVRSAPLLCLAAGFVFAALQTGSMAIDRQLGIPREISQVMQAVLIILLTIVTAASRKKDRTDHD
ncbi:ABC transporter permease [Streptomyces sp. NPDC055078]